MRKIKTTLLLVALLAFSSELFAENNVTDSNVSLSSNDEDDLFEGLEGASLAKLKAQNEEAHAQYKKTHQEKIKLGKVAFANRNK